MEKCQIECLQNRIQKTKTKVKKRVKRDVCGVYCHLKEHKRNVSKRWWLWCYSAIAIMTMPGEFNGFCPLDLYGS